jgi:hypothetical protein
MRMPHEILTRLLKGEHFNVEQRKELGLWPSETLKYTDVLEHLASLIEQHEWFPFELDQKDSAATAYEGIIIHSNGISSYQCYARRTSAINPDVTAEESKIIFKTAMGAAEYYLKWALNLPGNLDGWPVV